MHHLNSWDSSNSKMESNNRKRYALVKSISLLGSTTMISISIGCNLQKYGMLVLGLSAEISMDFDSPMKISPLSKISLVASVSGFRDTNLSRAGNINSTKEMLSVMNGRLEFF
ncbi:MAG: hypothetical protein ACR2IS_14920 [Nitrososphaeraceae archaeon]